MTNKEIIKKSILKATKNGFDFVGWLNDTGLASKFPFYPISTNEVFEKIFLGYGNILDFQMLIFDHKFAKAFFGKKWEDGDTISVPMSEILEDENIKKWQHHLRQMVLKKKPLLYLKKFL